MKNFILTFIAILIFIMSLPMISFGSSTVRVQYSEKGFTYQARFTEIETCKLNSLVNNKIDGTDIGDAALKFYNASDTELVAGTQAELDANCVKTILDWEPAYDMELIGGSARVLSTPSGDMYIHVRGLPDLTPAQEGSKDMVCGANLKFLDPKQPITFDGRAAKLLPYKLGGFPTNKMRVQVNGAVGENVRILVKWEHFKQ